MKTLIISVAMSAAFIWTAPAQVIAYESFSGLTIGGGILGTGGDSFGWAAPWSGTGISDARYQIVDPTPDLSFQVSGGGLIQGGNRAIQLSTAPEPVPIPLSVFRGFPNQNTTLYFSCLIRVPASGTGSDAIEVNFMNGNSVIRTMKFTPSNPSPPIGTLWILGPSGGSGYPVAGDGSQTHLLVMKYVPSGDFGFWIDPAYSSFNAPTIFVTGLGPGKFDGITFNIMSADAAGPSTTVILDEIRVGFTWPDVVPTAPLPVVVPDLLIAPAVKLRWQTETGKTYRIQYSYDLTNWFNLGSAISGNNQIKEVFDSTNSDAKKFYRILVQ